MRHSQVITGLVLIGTLAAAPAFAAADDQRQRGGSDRRGERAAEQSRGEARREGERAVPRQNEDNRRQYDTQRRFEAQRQYDARRNADRWRDNGYRYPSRGYPSRTVIVPRVIRPNIVTVVPYRPYVYRPRFSIGVYYGAGGAYPYGYTPRGYYDPLPGRPYGGLRITGAPREAQVFVDGYYVGIVDDFDGVFQHVNLEAGDHHIEVEAPGLEPVAFDVLIQPGRTITFRADVYPY